MDGRRPAAERWDVLLAVAFGGAVGSLARYALARAFPHLPGEFPLATLLANILGCLLIGALMAAITESTSPHRLLRPFFGIGVLGGFTTFSAYALDIFDLGSAGAAPIAVLYALGTVLGALIAAGTGLVVTRTLIRWEVR